MTLPSSRRFAAGPRAGWRWRQPDGSGDEIWTMLAGSVDAILRSCYGIHEFVDDPVCVLRIADSHAHDHITLADGTEIAAGDPIGTIHFWNEHLPRYHLGGGPDIRWASAMLHRVRYSLHELAERVAADEIWHGAAAFRADAALSSRLGVAQLRRVADRLGFEWVAVEPSALRQLHHLGESVNAWGLARAYNPAAASRQRFLRPRQRLWMSRTTLLQRYGDDARRRSPPLQVA